MYVNVFHLNQVPDTTTGPLTIRRPTTIKKPSMTTAAPGSTDDENLLYILIGVGALLLFMLFILFIIYLRRR